MFIFAIGAEIEGGGDNNKVYTYIHTLHQTKVTIFFVLLNRIISN